MSVDGSVPTLTFNPACSIPYAQCSKLISPFKGDVLQSSGRGVCREVSYQEMLEEGFCVCHGLQYVFVFSSAPSESHLQARIMLYATLGVISIPRLYLLVCEYPSPSMFSFFSSAPSDSHLQARIMLYATLGVIAVLRLYLPVCEYPSHVAQLYWGLAVSEQHM